jgi:hypothetical protein
MDVIGHRDARPAFILQARLIALLLENDPLRRDSLREPASGSKNGRCESALFAYPASSPFSLLRFLFFAPKMRPTLTGSGNCKGFWRKRRR